MGSVLLDVVDRLGQVQRLDPVADKLQPAINNLFFSAGAFGLRAKNALHGVWLGHPLHPALTDVPIGAWTTAAVLDVLESTGRDELRAGADAAIGLGLAGATVAAVSGLTDWASTDGAARRQGLIHGWLNGAVTLLYVTSFLLRRNGQRPAGRGVALAAYALANVSAYIGGHLVSGEKVGVDHAPRQLPGDRYVSVMAEGDLPENTPRRAEVDCVPIVLVRQNGRVHALAETCAHLGGPLAEGRVEGDGIVCPWHGSRFALEDGHVLDGPSTWDQPCFAVRVRDGQVEVRGDQPPRTEG
jgi:nitrite reductase/ring-hydroxylating ferredoxin subunit/uncharacterized membrane protein